MFSFKSLSLVTIRLILVMYSRTPLAPSYQSEVNSDGSQLRRALENLLSGSSIAFK